MSSKVLPAELDACATRVTLSVKSFSARSEVLTDRA